MQKTQHSNCNRLKRGQHVDVCARVCVCVPPPRGILAVPPVFINENYEKENDKNKGEIEIGNFDKYLVNDEVTLKLFIV